MEIVFHNEKKRNFNKPIGKHTTIMKTAEGKVQVELTLKRPKIRSLRVDEKKNRNNLSRGIFSMRNKTQRIYKVKLSKTTNCSIHENTKNNMKEKFVQQERKKKRFQDVTTKPTILGREFYKKYKISNLKKNRPWSDSNPVVSLSQAYSLPPC